MQRKESGRNARTELLSVGQDSFKACVSANDYKINMVAVAQETSRPPIAKWRSKHSRFVTYFRFQTFFILIGNWSFPS